MQRLIKARTATDSKIVKAATKIDIPEPAMILHCFGSDIKFDNEITKGKAGSRSKGQTATNDHQSKKRWYSLYTCLLIKAETTVLDMSRRAEAYSEISSLPFSSRS